MPADADRFAANRPHTVSMKAWLLLAAAAYLAAVCCAGLAQTILPRLPLLSGEWRGTGGILMNLLPMAGGILAFALLIRGMCGMSLREFILGRETGLHAGPVRRVLLLYLAGYALAELPQAVRGELMRNSPAGEQLAVNAAVCLCLVPLQSAGEEFIFRGIFLRGACGERLRCTPKAVRYGVLSSLIFMLMHSGTAAVSEQREVLSLILIYAVYLLQGGLMYAMDLYFGDLTPGIAWHCINNFFAYWLLSSEGSALSGGTVLIGGQRSAGEQLLATIVLMLPMVLCLLAGRLRKFRQGMP